MGTVCRNVKRWQGGDQYLRWVGRGMINAESRWYRVQGYRELSVLVKELELAVLKESRCAMQQWHDSGVIPVAGFN